MNKTGRMGHIEMVFFPIFHIHNPLKSGILTSAYVVSEKNYLVNLSLNYATNHMAIKGN